MKVARLSSRHFTVAVCTFGAIPNNVGRDCAVSGWDRQRVMVPAARVVR